MNMNSIINMAVRTAMRVVMAMGVKGAINWFSKSRNTTDPLPGPAQPERQISDARMAAKRARQAARITRRGL